jgi:uncharacterized cysteine cluster protein YcgN (CxxCxxCC family)
MPIERKQTHMIGTLQSTNLTFQKRKTCRNSMTEFFRVFVLCAACGYGCMNIYRDNNDNTITVQQTIISVLNIN